MAPWRIGLVRQLARGLRALTNRSAADRDIADEVEDYLQRSIAAHQEQGLSLEAARRAARLEMGSPARVREDVRGYGWENVVETFAADLAYAMRGLRATPGFTAIVLVTLALGIGGASAIFSAARPQLFDPLPYPEPDRIVMIWETDRDWGRNDGTFGLYRWIAERSRSFDALAVVTPWAPSVVGGDQPERLAGQRVSASYFRALGVSPAIGRDFVATDDVATGPNVVILSDRLWQRRFGGTDAIVGAQIRLDDDLFTVVGIMPRGFANVVAPGAELWAPLQYDITQEQAWGHHLHTIGRLRSGVSVSAAAEEIDRVGQAALSELRPVTYGRGVQFATITLAEEVTRGVRPTLMLLLGAVGLVLAIACVNVTNLLVGRGAKRRGELALRAALGAKRNRLVRQLLTESLLLAFVGGLLGVVVAVLGVRVLVALVPAGVPRVDDIRVDVVVLAGAVGISALVGLGVGLIPAVQAARRDAQQGLYLGASRGHTGHRRLRGTLVVVEVALALVLLASSGLLYRSLQRLFAVPMGFDSSGVLTLQVQAASRRFDNPVATRVFFEQVLEAVRRVPGVAGAAYTSQLPLSGDRAEYGVTLAASPNEGYSSFVYAVSPGYVETMRIPVRSGRSLEQRDDADAPRVALVSESLARRRFGGESPLGRRVRIGPPDSALYTIVGVVADTKQLSLAMDEAAAVYTTAGQWPQDERAMSVVVRTVGSPERMAPAIRAAVSSVDHEQPVARVATMANLVEATAAERRFALVLLQAFALAALLLTSAGIYGVLIATVVERTREIGVRSALGASRVAIVTLIVRQGLSLAILGVTIGLAGAALASNALTGMLFGISRLDPPTYASGVVLIGIVAAVACGVPAWRAARVDPVSTLRAE